MADRCILSIDPGLSGAFAIYYPDAPERVFAEDMPVVDGEVDPHPLASRIALYGPALAVVERVGPMPRDGIKQAFRFGSAYSVARTVVALAHVPTTLVTPQTWKKRFNLRGGDEGKEAARALAIRLFPASADRFARKLDHGRAEAALLAKYAAEKLA